MQGKTRFLFVFALILALLVSGCSSQAGESGPETDNLPETGGASSVEELVEALQSDGAKVELLGSIEQVFFSVEGQVLGVNGAEVQVFEYADEAAREAESQLISPDGSSVGTAMITWVSQPHFWVEGKLIALYVGEDQAIVDLLSGVLGEPIAQR